MLLPLMTGAVTAQPRFVAHTLHGTSVEGTLQQWESQRLALQGEKGSVKTVGHVTSIRRVGQSLPAVPEAWCLVFANGDCLALQPNQSVVTVEDRVAVWAARPGLGDAKDATRLFPPYLALMVHAKPTSGDDAATELRRLTDAAKASDAVLLTSGEIVQGTILALDAKRGCKMKWEERSTDIAWNQLSALAWNAERGNRLRNKAIVARLVLDDGSRLSMAELSYDDAARRWLGKTVTGVSISLAVERVRRLDQPTAHEKPVSELKGITEGGDAFLTQRVPLGINQTARGRPLLLGGDVHDRGIEMRGTRQVTFALDGKYTHFSAVVGLADDAGPQGAARAYVEVDGQRIDVAEGAWLKAGDTPRSVRVDITRARKLTLGVEAGRLGPAQCQVIWADANILSVPK